FIRDYKDNVTVELTPQHLSFHAEHYDDLGSRLQMNPPIRGVRHQERLWWGLRQGIADVLGSDHAPHTLAEKSRPYPDSPSGMPGVQTLVPVMLDHVAKGRLSLQRFVDLSSAGPARVFNIACKGRIAVGYDADLTVVDLKRTETITDDWSASRSGWTPYDGIAVTGWPVGTIVRGLQVMWDGGLIGASKGAAVRFGEALP
ncbi:MAG: amidohydrolase family protein, partial [Hyphomicrobiales bacterium]|nr:amidohydrolase family protein [Hyphomicrobiales bacterium]